jgi:preprotein translocase subunit SecA
VQMMGGIVLHQGKIAEMRTGEGKTLTATLPAYLHGLSGLGAHIVTVNDYLARRDAEMMGKVYNFLGLSVGCIIHDLSDQQRQEAYACDITYGTNNEFGFDFLRDNMKTQPDRLVQQRGHNFAIVDEVDSILIDEARTPLIISGPTATNLELYKKVNASITGLQKDGDYIVDEKSRAVSLTEDGISKMERRLNIKNIYDPESIEYLHHIQQALKAHVIFKKDVDYVVRDGQVVIVDEFTGRMMPGRRYSDGLHGALEAKEHVPVQNESQTLATITFQNYFRLYKTLSGMTGTADTEAVEFHKIYGLDVVVIPTNRPLIRQDDQDVVYLTAREKFLAIVHEITEAQKKGQPVLVGTASVEVSELLSSLLRQKGVEHDVLNAKNHAREAEIIAQAGQSGRVTIATNMAGRGTDIVLGKDVPAKGGLFVVGTERNESRRIDNQLRGRSGRQGDAGRTQFFLSLEDDLMRIFASDRLSSVMSRLGMKEGESITSPMVTRAIERAQKRVEEQNFSSRKNLLEYDDVMNQQRQVIYGRRKQALLGQAVLDFFEARIESITDGILTKHSPEGRNLETWDMAQAAAELHAAFQLDFKFDGLDANPKYDAMMEKCCGVIFENYAKKRDIVGEENLTRVKSFIYLQIIDQAWKEHLLAMDTLKDSVSLRGYAQRDPLQEYKKEAFTLFSTLIDRIEEDTTLTLIRMPMPEREMFQPPARQVRSEEEAQYELHHDAPASALAVEGEVPVASPKKEEELIYPKAVSMPVPQAASVVQAVKREAPKVGRNDPCPCGSGKKFKKCHGDDVA